MTWLVFVRTSSNVRQIW